MEAIVLAGGLGTRLRSAVPDLPKCMAPVNGKPFISYVIDELHKQGVTQFIFSLGYMSEVLINFINNQYASLNVQYTIEQEPLGTGGAIQLACTKAKKENVLITNGDTLFKVNTHKLFSFHTEKNAACTLSLKPMQNFERYGVVELNENACITSFKEKQFYKSGLINGGIYALRVQQFLDNKLPQKFSFEKDYLETFYTEQQMFSYTEDAYFIDIGIPEDYKKAQIELA